MLKLIKWFFIAMFLCIVGVVLVFVYASKIEPELLITRKFEYNYQDSTKETQLKVVQFTDTHIGPFFDVSQLEKVVKKINKQNPDVVVFTGDLFDTGYINEETRLKVEQTLAEIQSKYGKFAVYGNRDWGGGMIRHYEEIMIAGGFTVLQDEYTTLEVDGKKLVLYGADEAMLGNFSEDELQRTIVEKDKVLVLVHEPDVISKLKEVENVLFLSGHSHGGQVRLPFIGGLGRTSLAEIYSKDWYDIGKDAKLFVSSGLGNTKFSYRLGNIPEIVVHKLNL